MQTQIFIIDRDNDYKVKASYSGTPSTKAQAQWGALGNCFSITKAEDFIAQGHTGPEMFQIMAHYIEVKKSFRKRARADIAKRVFQTLVEADIAISDTPSTSIRARDHSGHIIKIIRKTFNGHKTSVRRKCYDVITEGMTVDQYLNKAIAAHRLSRAQALGCLQKLASHPTTPSIMITRR